MFPFLARIFKSNVVPCYSTRIPHQNGQALSFGSLIRIVSVRSRVRVDVCVYQKEREIESESMRRIKEVQQKYKNVMIII